MFKIIEIIDGKTIKVSPSWTYLGECGDYVTINKFEITENADLGKNTVQDYEELCVRYLHILLDDKQVELVNPIDIQSEGVDNYRIVCSVYLNDVNIARYFPDIFQDSFKKKCFKTVRKFISLFNNK